MSTRPAEMVRLGSMTTATKGSWHGDGGHISGVSNALSSVFWPELSLSYLELLVGHLRVDVDARQPASVARVRVVPANGIFKPSNLLRRSGCQHR